MYISSMGLSIEYILFSLFLSQTFALPMLSAVEIIVFSFKRKGGKQCKNDKTLYSTTEKHFPKRQTLSSNLLYLSKSGSSIFHPLNHQVLCRKIIRLTGKYKKKKSGSFVWCSNPDRDQKFYTLLWFQ